jgi:molybdopterin-guanine dinucleotide biosynthesis protein B
MDKDEMRVIAVSGLKNSGKTALIEALIPLLAEKGIRTAVIKHHGHRFGEEIPDTPGTDTYRFLANGACGTVIYDDDIMMCVRRTSAGLPDLIALFPDADLIVIEGAKSADYPRVAMLRTGQPISSDEATLLCAVTDPDYDAAGLPEGLQRFDFGDFGAVAEFLAEKIISHSL